MGAAVGFKSYLVAILEDVDKGDDDVSRLCHVVGMWGRSQRAATGRARMIA